MLPPERSLPVSVPSATTPLAVARKLVIFACIESDDDDVAALAAAGTANARMAAIAASMAVRGLMRSAVPILRIVRILTFHPGPPISTAEWYTCPLGKPRDRRALGAERRLRQRRHGLTRRAPGVGLADARCAVRAGDDPVHGCRGVDAPRPRARSAVAGHRRHASPAARVGDRGPRRSRRGHGGRLVLRRVHQRRG